MNKRLFVLLVILMSLSLVGIIFVQSFWIKQSVDDKEESFSRTVSEVLMKVADKIAQRESRDYFDRFISEKDSLGSAPVDTHFSNIFFIDRDLNSDEIKFYSHGILEEEYNIPSTFFDNGSGSDSTIIKNITSKRVSATFRGNSGLDGKFYTLDPIQKLEKIGGLTAVQKAQFEDVFNQYAKLVPIHKRVSKQEIELLLDRELENRNYDIDFEYGV